MLHELSKDLSQYALGIKSYERNNLTNTDFRYIDKVRHSEVKFFISNKDVLLSKGFLEKINLTNVVNWDIYHDINDNIKKSIDSYSRFCHKNCLGEQK